MNEKESELELSGETVTSRCEYKIYQHRTKKDGSRQVTNVNSLSAANVGSGPKDRAYAYVVQRFFDEKHKLEKTSLMVHSPYLLRAFRDVVKSYPTLATDFTQSFEMDGPFQMLYHYWEDLEKYRDATADDQVRMHVNLLFEIMDVELGPDRERVSSMMQKGQINFETLWTIFRPGDILYTTRLDFPWLLVCEKTSYEWNSSAGPYMTVDCSYTEFDGKVVGTAKTSFRINQKKLFGGGHPAHITSLPVYPRLFVEQTKDELDDRLKKRGEKLLEFRETTTTYYNGMAEYLKEPPSDYYGDDLMGRGGIWLPYAETGRVVLDRITFNEDFRLERAPVMTSANVDPTFCPPYLIGYSLARKNWCRFYLDNVSRIKWNANAWETLILEEEKKLVLRATVSSHEFSSTSRDQGQQKGKGLVVLLHGSPGSGKTLTAECAAEVTNRPLISSTLGELNDEDTPWDFERALKRLLYYATKWQAVVLLDEADVFLESRDAKRLDSKRSALVAVFLKHLEFFSGIIFLTTNRLGVLDPAMKSRVHLAMGYSPPGIETRRQLWLQHLSKMPPDSLAMNPEKDINDFLGHELNGREIAYAISTARTIARYQKQPLGTARIELVLKVRKDFEVSLEGPPK